MRTAKFWLLGVLLASPAAFALPGSVVATDNVKARLVSEVSAIAPGQSFWVALELNIRDGWHTYWRNPGDSGQATTLKWVLPAGFTATVNVANMRSRSAFSASTVRVTVLGSTGAAGTGLARRASSTARLPWVLRPFALHAAWRSRYQSESQQSPTSVMAESLSERESNILKLIAEGRSNKEIARNLAIAPETVKSHVKHIFTKLNVEKRAQAVSRAQILGLAGTHH